MPLFQVLKRGATSPRDKGGDLYVSMQKGSGGRYQLALRISAEAMDRLRWRRGDRVIPTFDKHGDTGVWTIEQSDRDDACVLHAKSVGTSGIMKATISQEHMDLAFPNGKAGYVGTLDEVKGGVARFLIDYAQ